jgi:hypothetical protein
MGNVAHVIDDVSRVATKREKLLAPERHPIPKEPLYNRHPERRGDKSDPVLIEERKRLVSEAADPACGDTECGKQRRERCTQ